MKKLLTTAFVLLAACAPSPEPPPPAAPDLPQQAAPAKPVETQAPAAQGAPAPTAAAQAEAPAAAAKIGQPAPDFTLTDLDGKTVRLADFKGKTVVLEWFNPGCPFVQAAHKKGSLKGMAARYTSKGTVWLAINSGAAGKQGHGKEVNAKGKTDFGMSYPILLDESGTVGRAYGAKRTPHMYVIDPAGVLVYAGAIDSTQGGEPEKDDKVINYVEAALGELAQGKPVSTAETESFGCSVKY